MGHTATSQRRMQDEIFTELHSYAKSLRQEDREIFEKLLKKAYRHYGSTSYASSLHAWAFMLLSIMVEMEKEHVAARHLSQGQQTRALAERKI